MKRVAADQLVWAPIAVVVFFTSNSLMEGNWDLQKIQQKLKNVYWETLMSNWTLWPGVQMLNFNFVPVNYQALVVSVIALGWNSYMSLQNSKGEKEPESEAVVISKIEV